MTKNYSVLNACDQMPWSFYRRSCNWYKIFLGFLPDSRTIALIYYFVDLFQVLMVTKIPLVAVDDSGEYIHMAIQQAPGNLSTKVELKNNMIKY